MQSTPVVSPFTSELCQWFEQITEEDLPGKIAHLNHYLDWFAVGQVYRLERKFVWMRQGKVYETSCKVECGITSLSREKVTPGKLLAVRCQH